MNHPRSSTAARHACTAAVLFVMLITARPIHAQNTHSAQLIRAQQQSFSAADSPSLNFGNGSLMSFKGGSKP